MIKLFTLENLSAFSADTVYKICLSLEKFGLAEDSVYTFESYEEMYDAAISALQNGDRVLIAADTSDYNGVKKDLISKMLLDEYSCPNIAEKISQCADGSADIDMAAHCLIPRGSLFHLSADGLYSGFTCPVLAGTLSLLPLDFNRVDPVISSLAHEVLEPKAENQGEEEPVAQTQTAEEEPEEKGFDFALNVNDVVSRLIRLEKTVAFATGEATMEIYNLYNRIEGLSDVANFVEIVDDVEEGENPEETTESEAVKTVRHAREAMFNTDADFGAAVSDVLTAQNEEGVTNYFVYIAVAEKKISKTKKINTSNPDDLELLLPHCVAILCDTLSEKLDVLLEKQEKEKEEAEAAITGSKDKKEEKKLSKGMIIFAAAILVLAAVTPIIIISSIWNRENKNPTNPSQVVNQTTAALLPGVSETTASLFPGITDSQNANASVTNSGNNLTPKEPAASDVSAASTAAPAPSKSGKFTFYVFGYGHGVGMSQNGANYLANQGWNYAQILSNYYYGTVLVSGDTYPTTINYNGTDYKTREFLASSLESEMGGSFHKEALKAQAVALYTFAKYNSFKLTTASNAFGKQASSACYEAVDEVMKYGLYVAVYPGTDAALTPFHAISAGKTTSYYNVWGGTAVTYLAGGRPSYGDYEAKDFKTTYSITSDELKSIVKSKLKVDLSGDPSTWITIISHDGVINENIGYVSSMNVGGKIISGNEFRTNVLEGKIRSHCFMMVYTPDSQ